MLLAYKEIFEAPTVPVIGVNEELRNFLLRRSHYIQRFENGTINDLVAPYNQAKQSLMSSISRLEDYGSGYTKQYRLDRLNVQLNEIDHILRNATVDSVNNLTYNLEQFSMVEADFYHSLLGNTFNNIGVNITRIPYEQVSEIVRTPLGGATYSDRMLLRYQESVFLMKNELTQSVILGENMAKASRRLVGVGVDVGGELGKRIKNQSEVIARTEIMRVSNGVSRRIYEENKDILKGVQYLATLDDRTCPVCGVNDGKIFYFDKNPVTSGEQPPLHPRCRCVLIPITKTWKELGAEKQEPPEGGRPFVYKGTPPHNLSSRMLQFQGNPNKWAGDVPASLNYEQWLRTMNVEDSTFVKNILGPNRYRYWSEGRLTLKQMVSDNRVLTLDELATLPTRPTTPGVGVAVKKGVILDQDKQKALDLIEDLILSGGKPNKKTILAFTEQSAQWLDETVLMAEQKLYRGISLLESRLTPAQINIVNNLKAGDDLPEFLFKQHVNAASYTKKQGLAKSYAQGKMQILVEADVPKNKILADLENLPNLIKKHKLKQSVFDIDDLKYMKRDKEVFVLEPIKARILSISGKKLTPAHIDVGKDIPTAKKIILKKPTPIEAKITVAPKPKTYFHQQWALEDKINAITMDDFVMAVRAKKWDEVAKHMDDILSKQELGVVQHNLNELNVMRYMFDQGMTAKQARTLLGDYMPISRAKLYKGGSPVKPIPKGTKARFTQAQQKVVDEKQYIITQQDRDIAEFWEKDIARRLEAEHITGNRPYDFFINNEFIEHKTVLRNTSGLQHQLDVDPVAITRKLNFKNTYKVRQHQTAIDMTPDSDTFGNVFYRGEIGKWRLKSMENLGHIDDPATIVKLKARIMQGAKKFDQPPVAKANVPIAKSLKQAENWAVKNLDVNMADYDEMDTSVANLFNQYLKGVADEYKIKPSAIRVDATMFIGKNKNLAGLAFEDGTIAFNPKYFKSMDDLVTLVKEQHNINWFMTDSRGHIFRHELAHQKYFRLGGTESMANTKLSKKTISELKKGIGDTDLHKFVSKYSLKSEGEFYAEQMARQMNGVFIHPVAKKVMNDIERRVKRANLHSRVKIKPKGVGAKIENIDEFGFKVGTGKSKVVQFVVNSGDEGVSIKNIQDLKWNTKGTTYKKTLDQLKDRGIFVEKDGKWYLKSKKIIAPKEPIVTIVPKKPTVSKAPETPKAKAIVKSVDKITEIDDIKSFSKWASDNIDDVKLTKKQYHELNWYKEYGHDATNKALRTGVLKFKDVSGDTLFNFDYTERIKLLDQVLNKVKGIKAPIKVFRALAKPIAKKYFIGEEIVDMSYMSTTAIKSVTKSFVKKRDLLSGWEKIIYEIDLPKGQKAFPIISKGEAELLLPRGMKFIVKDIKNKGKHIILGVKG